MTQVFGGIDLGTSSMKAVLVEVEGDHCRLVWSSTQAYNDEGAPERSPAQWWRVANILLDEMVSIALPEAIGFSGQMHTLLAVDDKKQLIAPVKLWLDMDGDAALARFPLTQSEWVAKQATFRCRILPWRNGCGRKSRILHFPAISRACIAPRITCDTLSTLLPVLLLTEMKPPVCSVTTPSPTLGKAAFWKWRTFPRLLYRNWTTPQPSAESIHLKTIAATLSCLLPVLEIRQLQRAPWAVTAQALFPFL